MILRMRSEIMAEHSNATLAFLTDNNENTL